MIGPEKDEPMDISEMLIFQCVTTSEKPLSITENTSKLQEKSVIRPEKEEPMEISVMLTFHWETSGKLLSIMKNT